VLKDNLSRLKPVIARELAEAQMRRERAQADVRLGSAIECIAEGIALYDSEDRLILCNQRYREILDRCKPYIISSAHYEDILRHAVLNGQFGETSADLEGFIQKLLAGHRGSRESFEQKFSDGRWVRIEERQTKSGGIISVLTDVTERKKLDMMKGEFISIVGHELRTPLTAIKGSLALLESRAAGELSAKAAAMINIAHKNSDRLVRLINDILDLQKIESGKMQFEFGNVAVETLLEQAVSANRSFAEGYDVGIELNEPPDSMLVLGDSDRLMQVMTNLLSNAVKFSPSGGTITVAAEQIADTVRISVADQGPGIPDSFHDQLFQRFSQADSSDTRKMGGTGLGLSITKAIVESHGGTIDFKGEEGQGTTFFFDLPIWRPDPARAAKRNGSARPKVLVCDDDDEIRKRLKTMIAELDCDVETCVTADEAMHFLSDGGFAAMTLDIALPDRSGVRLIREVRERPQLRDMPIIVVSAAAQNGRAKLAGGAVKIVDWLEKPVDGRRLKLSVERAIGMDANRRPRVLHVEDNCDHQFIVSQVVGKLANIETAVTYSEARERLMESDYDLVILDLLLPDGSGESLLPLIYADAAHAPPVLIFSVKEVPQVILENTAGALVKSRASNDTLKDRIEQLLSTGRAAQDVALFANARG